MEEGSSIAELAAEMTQMWSTGLLSFWDDFETREIRPDTGYFRRLIASFISSCLVPQPRSAKDLPLCANHLDSDD